MITTVVRSTVLITSMVPTGVRVLPNRQYLFNALVVYTTDWEAGLRYWWQLPPYAELSTKWVPGTAAKQEVTPHDGYNTISVHPSACGLLIFREWGLLTVGAVEDFVCLQFAQDVPHPAPTTIHPHSYLWLSDLDYAVEVPE